MVSDSGEQGYAFSPVPCLLSEDELAEKADELYSITWNGINRTFG